jgi:hypothetical protein
MADHSEPLRVRERLRYHLRRAIQTILPPLEGSLIECCTSSNLASFNKRS